jgi:NAD(P)H-dependent flavin oxidoreductase YrpB (nitropropane dioxygenase family)
MFSTRLTRDYDLDFPFVSAGMGFIALPELVVAVSNAGGLGLLGVGPAPPPVMQQMIRQIKTLTSRPFGVDLIHENTSLGPATTDGHIDACIDENIGLVVFFWNLPPAKWVERLREAGARVWYQGSAIAKAREAVAMGMAGIIAQGSEAGGHNKSELGLFALLPAMKDALPDIPVIAAGGISDGRGVAAALALGADGVCVGTRLLASQEAYIHREYQARVLAAENEDVVRTCIFGPEWPDQPMLVLRNRVVKEWAGRDDKTPSQPVSPQPIGQTDLFGHSYPMPKFSAALPTPQTSGDFEEMCLAAGRAVGLVREVKPAGEIVHEMMTQAVEHLTLLGAQTSNAQAVRRPA